MEYEGIPCFSPEIFAWLRNPNPSAFKNFRKGVNELREEGAMQFLYDTDESKRDPILAAVGQLQLTVPPASSQVAPAPAPRPAPTRSKK